MRPIFGETKGIDIGKRTPDSLAAYLEDRVRWHFLDLGEPRETDKEMADRQGTISNAINELNDRLAEKGINWLDHGQFESQLPAPEFVFDDMLDQLVVDIEADKFSQYEPNMDYEEEEDVDIYDENTPLTRKNIKEWMREEIAWSEIPIREPYVGRKVDQERSLDQLIDGIQRRIASIIEWNEETGHLSAIDFGTVDEDELRRKLTNKIESAVSRANRGEDLIYRKLVVPITMVNGMPE